MIKLIRITVILITFFYVAVAAAAASKMNCKEDLACIRNEIGLDLYRRQQYREGLVEFQAAYALRQDPEFLISIGRCQHRLGQDREALASYALYQQKKPTLSVRSQQRLTRYIAESELAIILKHNSNGNKKSLLKSWQFWLITGALAAGTVALGLGIGLTPAPHQNVTWSNVL